MGQPRDRCGSDRIFEHPFLSLRRDHFRGPTGTDEKLAYLIEIADWVNIVAFDASEQVLLVIQYRLWCG